MKKGVICLLVLIALAFSNDLLAQGSRGKKKRKTAKKIASFKGRDNAFAGKRYWSFGGGVSAFNYFGDIAPSASLMSTDISFTRPGLNLHAFYRFHPRLAVKSSFNYGRIKGDDNETTQLGDETQWRYVRNLHFRNDIKELSSVIVIDLLKNQSSYSNRVVINPYVFMGVGLFHHNPKAIAPDNYYPDLSGVPVAIAEGGQWVALRPLMTGGQKKPYSSIAVSFPVGFGVRYKLNKKIDLSFEMAARYLLTDNIDDMSSVYANPASLKSDLARAMSDRTLEPVSASTGQVRNVGAFGEFLTLDPTRNHYYGFGDSYNGWYRGTAKYNDVYTITTISASYILGSGPIMFKLFKKKNAKFR